MGWVPGILRRAAAWKAFVQGELRKSDEAIQTLRAEVSAAKAALSASEAALAHLQREDRVLSRRQEFERRERRRRFAALLRDRSVLFDDDQRFLLARRGAELIVLSAPGDAAWTGGLGGLDPAMLMAAVDDGEIDSAVIVSREGGGYATRPAPGLLAAMQARPLDALDWLSDRALRPAEPEGPAPSYFERLDAIMADSPMLPFHAMGTGPAGGSPPPPFDEPALLPPRVPAEPRRRSALFLHNNYYHFNCLAAGLQARGWDAVTVSCESPNSAQRQFYHGEDVNLHDADPAVMRKRIASFLRQVPERFEALHFYGKGIPTFFDANAEDSADPSRIPWDFLELRRHRTVIGYMPSGCLDGALQSSIRALTGGLCSRCVWELHPEVCADASSLAWNRKLERLCDWVGLELDHATPERIGPRTVYGPVVTTLDPARWHPDLVVPEDMRVAREPGEIVIYHAVGNYEIRRAKGRDIKGTGAVLAAIERLKAEGFPVRLVFAHDIPSTRVRFLQVQADIVVDQLNYGRYGANAREAMMLGKPTLCRLTPRQAQPLAPARAIAAAPMRDASEETVFAVLKSLIVDPDGRAALGRAARSHALAWHGQDACAERYERVIDRIRAGLPPESDELYPEAEIPAPAAA